MDENFRENSDRGTAELVVVPELEGVGLTRPHSALVKIVTATTQNSISDVIKTSTNDVIKPQPPTDEVIKSPVNEVIKTPLNIIKTSLSDVIKTPLNDVMKFPVSDQMEDYSVRTKEVGHSSCSSSISSSSVTTSITSSPSLEEGKIISTFQIEQDWREAAQEPSLTVSCKKTTGELVKGRFGSGSRGKCILLGKEWFTPTEFEAHCGRSASKDWKRSIRFQGQSLLTLIEEGLLQVHATSCSCNICLDDDDAAGTVRLHRPYKRKRRDKIFLSTDLTAKVLKGTVSEEPGSTTSTVTLPVSELGDLTVVPGLVLSSRTSPAHGTAVAAGAVSTPQSSSVSSVNNSSPSTLANLPLDKAWERMNEVLMGLERSVSGARNLLEELKERTQQEAYNIRQKLLSEKEDAVTQAKLEAQFSSMAKSSEGFLVQVRDEDTGQSLQPIMLDSLISNMPSLNPVPAINSIRKKCVNCNRESELECSGCHNKTYCSDFCQRRDWINHQNECTRSSPPPEDPLNNVTQVPGYIFMLSD
ncbi:deformed epidermal autoregulatory factor 1 [Palaemon carinicauda]|uniref:deformed epidermal autoregulatory factor 1 n=1 Tax=Palaemon carinicauda TaxID=392227 RepID=UPI0035B64123